MNLFNKIKITLSLIVILLTVACSNNRIIPDEDSHIKSELNIPRGSLFISGTIISIEKDKLSKDLNSPCSKVPCWALVKVDSIFGSGKQSPSLQLNDSIKVHFVFTLSKTTDDLIPSLSRKLPGLKENDKFKGNIKVLASYSGKNNVDKNSYSIDFYETY
ncbi:MAG: hypothetical protein KKF62_08460 [Bacteroidetes bacterium]|nr:hypothetical protein [Bacteroidota bacterium]MBU1117099.1 hypothetical protein [Bacteroidota bacterium]MBU1799769.1 hypothetical protein [Bacteroidota bacterium]